MTPNQFRHDLQIGKKLIGCWASLASPLTTEILGQVGFDWILIDGEHAPNDLQTFMYQLMALKDSSSAPVVRPQWAEPIILKRLLDLGFCNFLMPFIDTAEQAREAIAATRYPPEGIRGISLANRANKFGFVEDYHANANDNIAVIVQIESRTAVTNVDEIAAVEGVDCLFIGPSDLSAAYGHFGNPMHPEIQDAIALVHAAGQKHGKSVGILAPVEAQAKQYLEQGLTFIAVGADQGIFRRAAVELRGKFI